MSLVSIRIIVDPAGALEAGEISNHHYMIDDQKDKGSYNQSTNRLCTAVKKGDELVWSLQSIECEAFVSIKEINVSKKVCCIQQNKYPGTDLEYWTAKIIEDVENLPYELIFEVGIKEKLMSNGSACRLIGVTQA